MGHERTRRKRYAPRDHEGRTRPVFGVDAPPPVGPKRRAVGIHPMCGHAVHLEVEAGQLLPTLEYLELTPAEIAARAGNCLACVPPLADQVGAGL